MNAYVIRKGKWYVSGYSNRGQGCVTVTDSVHDAKQFSTRAKAVAWRDRYSGAGYGLVGSENIEVVVYSIRGHPARSAGSPTRR